MQGKGWSKNMQDRISNFCISSKKIIAFIQFKIFYKIVLLFELSFKIKHKDKNRN